MDSNLLCHSFQFLLLLFAVLVFSQRKVVVFMRVTINWKWLWKYLVSRLSDFNDFKWKWSEKQMKAFCIPKLFLDQTLLYDRITSHHILYFQIVISFYHIIACWKTNWSDNQFLFIAIIIIIYLCDLFDCDIFQMGFSSLTSLWIFFFIKKSTFLLSTW